MRIVRTALHESCNAVRNMRIHAFFLNAVVSLPFELVHAGARTIPKVTLLRAFSEDGACRKLLKPSAVMEIAGRTIGAVKDVGPFFFTDHKAFQVV